MTEKEREGDQQPSAEEVGGTQPQAGGPAAPEKSEVPPPPAVPPPSETTPEEIAAAGEPVTEAPPAPPKAERPARAEREAKAPEKIPAPPESIAGAIAAALPDVTLDAYQGMSDIIVEIARDDVAKVMPVLKDDVGLDLKFLRCLFGVDHLDEGMEVIYQLLSIEKKHGVVIKTKLPKDDLRVASVSSIWNAANWHERETRDMFGIQFEGHPHLVPLLLPEDMTDHFPLRKDNDLAPIEAWQGEILGEHVGQAGHIPTGSRFEGVGGDAGGEEA
jgi:NADH-quinone oxidoreductase subunit C